MTSSVLRWLEASGRALELRAERTLRQVGHADVQPAFHYLDTVTGQTRESDIVAKFPWAGMQGVPCTITVAVECKSSTKYPWVAFFTSPDARRRDDLQEWAVFAHGPFVGITEPLTGLWAGHYPFTSSPAASHVVAAHNDDKNPAGDAVRQALSCAAAIRQDYLRNQSTERVGLVCLAVVVTVAPLLTCRLDADGSIVLEKVDEFDVWGYAADGGRHRVFVRTERSLSDLADALRLRAAEAGQ